MRITFGRRARLTSSLERNVNVFERSSTYRFDKLFVNQSTTVYVWPFGCSAMSGVMVHFPLHMHPGTWLRSRSVSASSLAPATCQKFTDHTSFSIVNHWTSKDMEPVSIIQFLLAPEETGIGCESNLGMRQCVLWFFQHIFRIKLRVPLLSLDVVGWGVLQRSHFFYCRHVI
jgi:hypothetical protein